MKGRFLSIVLVFLIVFIFGGCRAGEEANSVDLSETGYYYTKDDVAFFLYTYERLPDNYLTKTEAEELGWISSEGNLWEVAEGMVIGGDRFGNREGLLPESDGRKYFECDVAYEGGYRGAERLVYSNDGLIYYTPDHYESFTLLYGEE
jgi:hypothetical protein